jgi:hypothetical protein
MIALFRNFEKVPLCSSAAAADEQFLSLPKSCKVFEIRNVQQFRIFETQFSEYERKKSSEGQFAVGVDAEWNSYVLKSRYRSRQPINN